MRDLHASAQAHAETSRKPVFLTAEELYATLTFTAAVDALEAGLTGARPASLTDARRTVEAISSDADGARNELVLMPAWGLEGAGVKVLAVAHGNPHRGLPLIQGVYMLFAPDGLSAELLIDGAGITSLRTAAVSALATRHLARADSNRLVVFGAGAQAEAHVHAMCAVRPIERVTIVASSPTSPRAHSLLDRLSDTNLHVEIGAPADVHEADIVCTCTTSTAPVFDSSLLAPGTHVNGVGSYRPDMCELDGELLSRATVFVETREAASAEAGDILQAVEAGLLPSISSAHELSDLIDGRVARSSDEEITVFKSVGLAIEDLVIARAAANSLSDASPKYAT